MNPNYSPTSSAPAGGPGTGSPVSEGTGPLAETRNHLKQTAQEAGAKVKQAASRTAARAKEEAERLATDKKETAASRLGSYSSAIHETADSLEEKDPNLAWFSHQAADKLQGIADYMRSRDLGALRRDAEEIARRHPAAVYGGMFLAGLLIGNIVKASRRKLDDDDRDYAPATEYDPEARQPRDEPGSSWGPAPAEAGPGAAVL
jgi:hypothetical protein